MEYRAGEEEARSWTLGLRPSREGGEEHGRAGAWGLMGKEQRLEPPPSPMCSEFSSDPPSQLLLSSATGDPRKRQGDRFCP